MTSWIERALEVESIYADPMDKPYVLGVVLSLDFMNSAPKRPELNLNLVGIRTPPGPLGGTTPPRARVLMFPTRALRQVWIDALKS